jgi:hypothetical protein
VSIYTLRQHYAGPVCLFYTEDCRHFAKAIAADKRLGPIQIARTVLLSEGNPRPHWTAKAYHYLSSPYMQTIYLDGDTLVLADIDELFECQLLFAVTTCNGEKLRLKSDSPYPISLRKQIQKLKNYGPVCAHMVRDAERRNGYAANNGVLAFRKHHPALWEIHHLAVGFRKERLHDEIATQLVLPRHENDITYVGGEWNALTKYEDNWDNAKIVHLHHDSHWKNHGQWGGTRGRNKWIPEFLKARSDNAGGLKEWAGSGDKRLLEL